LFAPAAALAVWQFIRADIARPTVVHHEAALEGAKLLKDWCTWLATIATGTVGLAAFVPFTGDGKGVCAKDGALGVLAVIALGTSLVITATLLLALPSLVARFRRGAPHADNDFYEANAFEWAQPLFGPLSRVGFLAFAQYYFFVAGVLSIAKCALQRVGGQ